jgi:hypothetical protein
MNNLLSILYSFIFQIVHANTDLLPVLLRRHDALSALQNAHVHQKNAILVLHELLDHSGLVYLILDGLDEADERDRQLTLTTVLQLHEKCANLRVLVSSREEADIMKMLTKVAGIIKVGNRNREDIKMYVQQQGSELLKQFELDPLSKLGQEVARKIDFIVEKAEGKPHTLQYLEIATNLSGRDVSLCQIDHGAPKRLYVHPRRTS